MELENIFLKSAIADGKRNPMAEVNILAENKCVGLRCRFAGRSKDISRLIVANLRRHENSSFLSFQTRFF